MRIRITGLIGAKDIADGVWADATYPPTEGRHFMFVTDDGETHITGTVQSQGTDGVFFTQSACYRVELLDPRARAKVYG